MDTARSLQAKLGAQLRALRLQRGISVRTLATRTGFSPSFISQVESETVSPSIASLERIARELGVTLGELFAAIEATPRTVVRRAERAAYESAWSRSTLTMLADAAPGRKLSAFEVTVAPGGASGRAIPSEREALALVLAGSLVLSTAAGPIELHAGDAAYLVEGVPLAWENHGAEPARLLVVGEAAGTASTVGLRADAASPDRGEATKEAR
ncbi:MAG: helix-turn-helix domain-containing protein [Thermomicrobia bacterium]|nr:helix-turn-helix domain-containing protein [Thermomicrobia bacterium]